ncbi:MAG: type II toxin-antitoxin system RelE/ParE family toxin [Bacteroidota bacterium]|nr:type II toxin-antitoxin system RelE/ParE family toxin [Bacteroidota bacterium]
MEVLFHKKFLKDLAGLPSDFRKRIEKEAFENFPAAKSLRDIPGAEKMHGYKNYYKIRFGNYSPDFQVHGNTLILERVMHRKEIYRHFPID